MIISSKTTKIGIIGAGQIVEDAHLPVLKNFSNVSISWVADLDLTRANLLAKMYQVSAIPVTVALEKIPEVDVCLLAIPVGARERYLNACADNKIAAYVEKPFARTVSEHQSITNLFSPYAIAAGFQRRFYQNVAILRQVISSGIFGRLQEVSFNQGSYDLKSGGATRFITNPLLSGGGTMIESAIHGFDQILFATEANAVVVNEAKAIICNHIDYEAIAHSTIFIERLAVPVTTCVTRLRYSEQGFKFVFETATVRMGIGVNSLVAVDSHESQKLFYLHTPNLSSSFNCATTINQAFYLFWADFFHAIDEQKTNATSAVTSKLTTKWIEEIYQKILS